MEPGPILEYAHNVHYKFATNRIRIDPILRMLPRKAIFFAVDSRLFLVELPSQMNVIIDVIQIGHHLFVILDRFDFFGWHGTMSYNLVFTYL